LTIVVKDECIFYSRYHLALRHQNAAPLIGILTYSSQANVCVTSQYTSEKAPFPCALCGPFAILRSAGSQPSPLSVSALYNVISASTVYKNYIHF